MKRSVARRNPLTDLIPATPIRLILIHIVRPVFGLCSSIHGGFLCALQHIWQFYLEAMANSAIQSKILFFLLLEE
ncbi:hypothetical protein Hanom_Chr15g01352601 [Helianthus anomalus]